MKITIPVYILKDTSFLDYLQIHNTSMRINDGHLLCTGIIASIVCSIVTVYIVFIIPENIYYNEGVTFECQINTAEIIYGGYRSSGAIKAEGISLYFPDSTDLTNPGIPEYGNRFTIYETCYNNVAAECDKLLNTNYKNETNPESPLHRECAVRQPGAGTPTESITRQPLETRGIGEPWIIFPLILLGFIVLFLTIIGICFRLTPNTNTECTFKYC